MVDRSNYLLYIRNIMNWDWEKLQEKRQRQKPSQKDTPKKEVPGNFSFRDNPFKKYIPQSQGKSPVALIVLGLFVLWLASGIFIVNPGSVGVVTRFGAYNRTVQPGPHYRIPFPIESRIVVNTESLRTINIGQPSTGRIATSDDESSMFTGDENIVHMHFNVQYKIDTGNNPNAAREYLFNVKSPDLVVRAAAEAAMREVVGSSDIDDILTVKRAQVQESAHSRLQEIMNAYHAGIEIRQVQLLDTSPPAEVAQNFRDVASAREDRNRFKDEATAYYNKIVPVANGTAKSIVNAAEAYKQTVILQAEGQAERFLALIGEYKKSPDILKKRMYLDTMNEILSSPNVEKVIISQEAKGGFLPYLNLDKVRSSSLPSPARGTSNSQGGVR